MRERERERVDMCVCAGVCWAGGGGVVGGGEVCGQCDSVH